MYPYLDAFSLLILDIVESMLYHGFGRCSILGGCTFLWCKEILDFSDANLNVGFLLPCKIGFFFSSFWILD